eukprot:Polyplicarium_translucidae@DN1503_c0_g1_i2.p1
MQESHQVSLKLRKLLNSVIEKWEDSDDVDDADQNAALRAIRLTARQDILDLWNVAVEEEKRTQTTHEQLELTEKHLSDVFEDREELQSSVKDLSTKLNDVEAFWKTRLSGVMQEVGIIPHSF